ncbi:PucR family transcriptional regulator [Pseudonocardia hispaniensis]|uniref:PucR family transcriptional regulator n=1 Tax=Pseudonocardia hispaniensis TaxID=904933 RepID=A0ABW1J605_9PSEU
MTRMAAPVVRAETGGPGPSLGQLLAEIAGPLIDVLCTAPGGLAEPVRRAHIWDASDGDASSCGDLRAGDLVLAVGLVPASPQLSRLLTAARDAAVAAVAIRGLVNLAWVRTEAERLGVTVLVVPRELAWDQVHVRVRTLVATWPGGLGGAAPTSSDLYAVANTAAAALGGPVEIDDAALNLLAFSNLPGEIDELRTTSILTRIPPGDFLTWLRESGTAARLRRTTEPLRIDPPGSRPRLVIPVRAGIDVLGYVWVAEGDEPFGERHNHVLAEVARVVSAHLVREGVAEDRDHRRRGELLVAALEGNADVSVLAAQLDLRPDTVFNLVGFRIRTCWPDPSVDPFYVRKQLELRRELAGRPGAAAVVVGGQVYAVLPVRDRGPDDLGALAEEIITMIGNQLGCEVVAAINCTPHPFPGLFEARLEVDRALRLLAADPERAVATCAELRPRATLALLHELAQSRPQLLAGPIQNLIEIDRTRKTDYIATLRAYFDTASDLTEAARILFVHRNTLRYRLRRIRELCGLDLSDPVERLIAELQLRLLGGAASGAPETWAGVPDQRVSS